MEEKLKKFLQESNRIEGIDIVTDEEVMEALRFIHLDEVTTNDLKRYVKVTQPNAKLRDKVGLNVRVGDYFPPKGGANIEKDLKKLLYSISTEQILPYSAHHHYEKLHPFTDGNGRSGRLLWLWHMYNLHGQLPPLGFLHTWYYQSLSDK